MFGFFRENCNREKLKLNEVDGDDAVTFVPVEDSDYLDHYYSIYAKSGEVFETLAWAFDEGTPDEGERHKSVELSGEEAEKIKNLLRECGVDF